LLLTYWFVNWIRHFSVQIWIHYLLTSVFVSSFLYQIARIAELSVLDQADTAHGLEILRVFVRVIAEIAFFAAILLLAKGWCIIRDSLPLGEILSSLVYSMGFIAFRLILAYVSTDDLTTALLLLMTLSLILFMRALIASTNDATMHILAHLLAIANAGINPRTTPIYHKHELYKRFHVCLLGGCVGVLLYMGASVFFPLPFTADEALADVIVYAVLLALCIIFRLRESGSLSYARIAESGGEIALADLESVSVNSDQLSGGRAWEEGMRLPGMPEIVSTAQATVVLASPDGTDTIDAKVGEENV
jgi:hypothetical protein